MAISPPSDIILDVARAADPERLKVATAKLDRLAETAGTAFADLMPAASEAGSALAALASATPAIDPSPSAPFDLHRARLRLQNETALAARVDGTAAAVPLVWTEQPLPLAIAGPRRWRASRRWC